MTPDGIYGSKNNLSELTEFYGNFLPNIHAIETGLSAGNYTVTIIDNYGCSVTETFTVTAPFGPEICNDGIDNDGDGLIDMQDTVDCECNDTLTTLISLIPNPSFEQMDCCPNDFSQMTCATTWIQASDATSDYFNTCGYMGGLPNPQANALQPFPDGNGCVGFIAGDDNYVEYVGACLLSPMTAGNTYSIDFNLAFNITDHSTGSELTSIPPSQYPPIDITLYGTTDCNDLPFSGQSCPLGQGNWQVLGTVNADPVVLHDNWVQENITFTPAQDIYAVVIGPPCHLPSDYAVNFSFYQTAFFYI